MTWPCTIRRLKQRHYFLAKIWVTYDSGYGATADAAKIIADAFVQKGLTVDLGPVEQGDLSGYDALVIGSPVRLGRSTPGIRRFLKNNLTALASTQVAFFFTCMSAANNEIRQALPLYADPAFADPDRPQARIRIMANNHTVSYYLKHFLKHLPGIHPIGISFFKGRLHTKQLSLFHRVIMRAAMFALPEIQKGDFIRPDIIRQWAENTLNKMKLA